MATKKTPADKLRERLDGYCSFCRKSHTEVGPLVEGPGEVYICGECVPLCQSIIDQKRRRRNPFPHPLNPTLLRERLDQFVRGQDEAKQALAQAAILGQEGRGQILLIGPSRSAKTFLARALAHALEVPFATGDASGLVKTKRGSEGVLPLLFNLLRASEFNIEAAQRGVVYLDGADQPEVQETLLHVWQGHVDEPLGRIQFNIRGVLFVCGDSFAALDEGIARSGRHPEQPVTAEALMVAGARPQWVRHLAAIARAAPLDEETLTRILSWVDFHRAESKSADTDAAPDQGGW